MLISVFVFFKQKTAYEMRISDWSSDVCSSDLMKVCGYISEHDFTVAERVAHVLCGGDVDPNSLVDEAWMMTLEREAFLHLLTQPKTQERIAGLLKTGKPVRN